MALRGNYRAIILHSRGDAVIPIEDSQELVLSSGLPDSALVVVGADHNMTDARPWRRCSRRSTGGTFSHMNRLWRRPAGLDHHDSLCPDDQPGLYERRAMFLYLSYAMSLGALVCYIWS